MILSIPVGFFSPLEQPSKQLGVFGFCHIFIFKRNNLPQQPDV
jgi:hypothetical protein